VSRIVRQSKNEELMAAGVTIVDPATTISDQDVEVGADTVIHPGVVIEGHTRIAVPARSRRTSASATRKSPDRDRSQLLPHSLDARVADGVSVGPFAHLRPETNVGPGAKIGNFVELKKTGRSGRGRRPTTCPTSRCHDRRQRQMAPGTITCNYDARRSRKTVIETCLYRSDSQLDRPGPRRQGAYVAAARPSPRRARRLARDRPRPPVERRRMGVAEKGTKN